MPRIGIMEEDDYTNSIWTNGPWVIRWADNETVEINGPYNLTAKIHGGDFENMLSALCSAYQHGRE